MSSATKNVNSWIVFCFLIVLIVPNIQTSDVPCNGTICRPINDDYKCHTKEPECTIRCTTALHDIPASWTQLWCELTDNSSLSNVHIIFQHNLLYQIPQLQSLTALTKLTFESNYINNISEFAFSNLSHLKSLSITGNSQLWFLNNNTFVGNNSSNLPLEVLDLSSNTLRTLPEGIFRNTPNLTELNLSDNDFQSWDDVTIAAINSLHHLKKLNLSKNGLRKLSKELEPTVRRLETLDLSNNNFDKVPEVLEYGSQLLRLDLSNNIMPDLNPMSFIGLENLQVLNISHEKVLKFVHPGSFSPLKLLEILICNNNDNLQKISLKSFKNPYGEGPKSTVKIELCNNTHINGFANLTAQDSHRNCTYTIDFTAPHIMLLLNEFEPNQTGEVRHPTYTYSYILMSVGLTACLLLIIIISIKIIRKKSYSNVPLTRNTSSVYSSVPLDDDDI